MGGTAGVANTSVVGTDDAGIVVAVSLPGSEQATTTRHNSSQLTSFNPLPLITPGWGA